MDAAAKKAYGNDAAKAYREIAAFVLDESLKAELIDPNRTTFTAAQLSDGIVGHLAPRTRVVWMLSVDRALAGDAAAREVVFGLRPYDLEAPELSLPGSGTVIDSQSVSGAQVTLAAASATSKIRPLRITFTHRARLSLQYGKSAYPGTVMRDVTLTVTPATATPSASSTSGTNPTTDIASSPATTSPSSPAAPTPRATTTPTAPVAKPAWLINQFDADTSIEFDEASATGPQTQTG